MPASSCRLASRALPPLRLADSSLTLRGVGWSAAVSRNGIDGHPIKGPRQGHRRGIRRPIATAPPPVRVSFRLQALRSRDASPLPMKLREALVAIEEEP